MWAADGANTEDLAFWLIEGCKFLQDVEEGEDLFSASLSENLKIRAILMNWQFYVIGGKHFFQDVKKVKIFSG